MYKGMARAAADRGQPIDDDGWYLANRALAAACDRERRYPTADEARQLIADTWGAAPGDPSATAGAVVSITGTSAG